VAVALSANQSPRNVGEILFTDGFELLPLGMDWVDNSRHGRWRSAFRGYGKVGVALDIAHVLQESPKPARRPSETHAALVTSLRSFGNLDLSLMVKTVKQLRSPRPNPWEVAWVLWHYGDNAHFYYLFLRPNGWMLGKEDPAYPGSQRLLINRSYPKFRPGAWYWVHVRQVKRTIVVWVGGQKLGVFRDLQRPYMFGKLGLYCEDSRVEFYNVRVYQA
jgi:hypothetical protein